MTDADTTPEDNLRNTIRLVYNYGVLVGSKEGAPDFEAYELLDPDNIKYDRFFRSLQSGYPFAETYDFLYNNHKDVLHELEQHLKDIEADV